MARKPAKHSPPGSAPSALAPAVEVDELIRQGSRAIDEYDYDLARSTLTRAFDLSGGAESATRALLDLLVEHLGADRDALELGERLSREAVRSPGVRLTLALAAARCGEHRRARDLLGGADGRQAADVWLVLAGSALSSGELVEAARLCDEARSHDSKHPGVQEMTHRIARAREELRRPLEDEITNASATGALEEAHRLAERLLVRFPESPVARHVVKAALERAREAEAERLLHIAEDASEQADHESLAVPLRSARAAVAAAPADPRRIHRLAVLEAALATRERDANVADVVRRLAEPDLHRGLLGYAALAEDARRGVRDHIRLPLLDDLEHLLARRVDTLDAIDALVAFRQAASIDNPEKALKRLAPHAKPLGHLAEATRLTAALRQQLADEQRRRATDVLTTARAALDRGDPDAAIVMLGELPARELALAERDAADALRAGARTLQETRALEAAFERLIEAGDPLAAREVAEQLLARARDDELPARQALLDSATSAARRAFRIWVSHENAALDSEPATIGPIELGVPLDISSTQEEALVWLDAEARSLVLLECCEQWLFFQVVDLPSRRVRTRAVVRTPESLDHFSAELAPDGVFTVAGGTGAVFAISTLTWDPLLWRASADIAGGEIVDDIEVAPGRRYAWIYSHPVKGSSRIRVVDLERRRAVREVSTDWWARPIAGADDPTMACSKRGSTLSLHHPGGTPMDGGRFELPANLRSVALHPTGGRLLAFLAEDEERLGYVEIDNSGKISPPRWLDEINPERTWICATSRAHRASYVVGYDDEGLPILRILRAGPFLPAIEPQPRIPLPALVLLARDPASRHVVALVPAHERMHVVSLGSENPSFPADAADFPQVNLRGLSYHDGCRRVGYPDTDFYATAREVEHQPDRSALAWMQRQVAAADSDFAKLLETYDILRSAGRAQLAVDVIAWMREHFPDDPHAALLEAERHAKAAQWGEVRERLESADLQRIILGRRRHAHHLLGLALAYDGLHERAADVFADGCEIAGECPLPDLLDFVDSSATHDAGSSPHAALRIAVRDADASLLAGDLPRARAALDVRIVWDGGEVQSLARLAEIELQAEPGTSLGIFRKALALARFLDAHRKSVALRQEMPLPGTRWAPERLAELERRAESWLERQGAPDTPAVPAPPWSRALQEFDDALAAVTADESNRPPARLAFRIQHSGHQFESIEPLLQRALRNGRYSAGQSTDGNVILAVRDQFVDDADAAAILTLTEGLAPASRTRTTPSRIRMLRLLGTLVGHPRVFLGDHPEDPVRVEHGRLGIACIESPDGLTLLFAIGGTRWTAAELLTHTDSLMAVDVDAEAGVVTMASIDASARALAEALERHQPAFPAESHDELLRRLVTIQHRVDLRLPEALTGTVHPTDSRPVVRLTPVDDAEMTLEFGVRPVPGAGFALPGEGTVRMLALLEEGRTSALRDHATEVAAADHIRTRIPLVDATRESKWRYRIAGEEQILAAIEALAELGQAVVVEWPKDARPWRWCGTVTRSALRVHISHERGMLRIAGDIDIDGHRVAIEQLLEAIRRSRHYVIVGPRMFVALADELRGRLEAAGDLLFAGQGTLEAGLGAAPVLADLVDDRHSDDAAWHDLHKRLTRAHDLDPAPPPGLQADLRPYQRDGFRWLVRLAAWGAGACLADDMGLGKTLQALALLVQRATLGPALVIAPTSVTPNWLAETTRFAPALRIRLYRGPGRDAQLAETCPGDVFIAGYGVVTRDADVLSTVNFSTLVLDEAQALKNAASRRTRAVQRLHADFRVALTGTPVENHLGDLWSLFRVLSPGLLGSWPQFRDRFAGPIERDRSSPQRAALARVLRPFLLRRTKEAVLPELPPRIDVVRLVNLSPAEQELYETARLAAAAAIAEATDPRERLAVLGWLTRLRRLACHPRLLDAAWSAPAAKLAAFLAIVDELREADHRALVFSQFTDHLALVREALTERGIAFQYLDGSTPVDDRARAVAAFQGGAGDLFLISLKAGGTGLNLTAADHVIHLDPWWNPAVEDQATDRAHRIGQLRPVTVIRLISRGTIEEAVLALHAEKRDLAEGLLAGTDLVGRMSIDALVELVRRGSGTVDLDDEDPEPGDAHTS